MKAYTNADKGNQPENLRKNWRENGKIRRKKKDRANKKRYRRKIKELSKIKKDEN